MRPKDRVKAVAAGIVLLGVLGGVDPLAGQATGTVTGRVTAANTQRPLSGAQVFIPGLDRGGLTNAEGAFTIPNVPVGPYTVRARMIGFNGGERAVEVGADAAVRVDFQLTESAIALDEVVVTGTAGAARRREIGNSISQINMNKVAEPVQSVEALLQGRAAGIQVQAASGSIGSGASIRLRGSNSVALSNQPLVYVDGVRVRSDPYPQNAPQGQANRGANVNASPLSDINPNDIERIEVIKGAAATTLYGTEAAAGVIQIFTRRGASGAPTWTAQVNQGMGRLRPFAPDVPMETGLPYGQAKYLFLDPWLRDAHLQSYSLSVTGGGDALQYFVSGSMDDNTGVLPNDAENKYVVRGNFTFRPLTELSLQWNTSYTSNHVQQTASGNNAHGLTLNAYRRDRNYFASYDRDLIDQALEQDIDTYVDRLILGGTATWTPTEWMTHRLTVGFDNAAQEARNVRPFGFFAAPAGIISDERWAAKILTFDYVGTMSWNVLPGLRSSLSFGAQSADQSEARISGVAENFPGVPVPTLTSGSIQRAYESRQRVINAGLFVQEMLGYRDRYFVTVGARVDGNSAFGQNFGLQMYPKVSGSWVVSDEAFWSERLGRLKLRAAYGQAGRAPGAFDAVRTWNAVGWGTAPALSPNNVGNPDLGPETTAETELGFDAAFLNDRVSLDFTFYHARTTDALFNVRLVPSAGFGSGSQLRNVGELENRGVEVALNAGLVQRPGFSWDMGLNVSTVNSRVLSLGGAPEFSLGSYGWVMEGQPVPVIRANRITNPDAIADPVIEEDYLYGPNQPTHTIGLSSSFELPYGIQLSARGEYMGGHYMNDNGSVQSLLRAVEWPTCYDAYQLINAGHSDRLTARQRGECIASNVRGDYLIYPGDFLKLRDVTLRVPVGRFVPRASSASLALSASNWLRWTRDFPMFDPEQGNNGGYNASVRGTSEHIPPPATLIASLRVVF